MFIKRIKHTKHEPELHSETPDSLRLIPKELLTKESVMGINRVIQDGGVIVTLRRGEEYLSLAAMQTGGRKPLLNYVITAEKHRHNGYAETLVNRLLPYVDLNKTAQAYVRTGSDSYEYAEKLLKKTGFALCGHFEKNVVRIESFYDFFYSRNDRERFSANNAKAESRGFRCIPFSKAGASVLEQVKQSHESDFGNPLFPAELLERPGAYLPDNSFAVVKDGALAGYTLVSAVDQYCVEFLHLAVSRKYRHGIFLPLLLIRTLDSVRDAGYQLYTYSIFDYNKPCLAVMKSLTPPDAKKSEFAYFRRGSS